MFGLEPTNDAFKVILLVACIFTIACESKKQAVDDSTNQPIPFDHSRFLEIVPMVNGAAYAKAHDSQIWYLRGNKALRVVTDSSQRLPDLSELTAVLDGGAYAISTESDPCLWYLHAEHAEKVREVAFLDASTAPNGLSDKGCYALYLSEHKKRKDAEYRADNPELAEPDEPDNGY
jgi:hypothetical protein